LLLCRRKEEEEEAETSTTATQTETDDAEAESREMIDHRDESIQVVDLHDEADESIEMVDLREEVVSTVHLHRAQTPGPGHRPPSPKLLTHADDATTKAEPTWDTVIGTEASPSQPSITTTTKDTAEHVHSRIAESRNTKPG